MWKAIYADLDTFAFVVRLRSSLDIEIANDERRYKRRRKEGRLRKVVWKKFRRVLEEKFKDIL